MNISVSRCALCSSQLYKEDIFNIFTSYFMLYNHQISFLLAAHPNVKAFISHGGLLSLTESIYHGVPLIVIPLFGDQWKNSIKAETAGFGITLDFDNITEKSIIWSLDELISKPS